MNHRFPVSTSWEDQALFDEALPPSLGFAASAHGSPAGPTPYWEQVIGVDTRRRIDATSDIPWRYICKIETSATGTRPGGTGTLIAPNKVLTAAHVVADAAVANIRVIPGKRGPTRSRRDEPFGNAMASRKDIAARFVTPGDENDYAVVTLSEPIGRDVGHWSRVAVWDDDRVRLRKSNLAGYPSDRHPTRDHLYHAYHEQVAVSGQRMEYLHDTFRGMSGSPVWIRWEETRTIVGVHVSMDDGVGVISNRGVHITDAVLTEIRSWL